MFDFSSLKARANQNDKKTAGTTGTTGTTNAGAGLRVPSTQNQNGDKRGQTTESTGKPAGNTGAALPIFGVPENLGTGNHIAQMEINDRPSTIDADYYAELMEAWQGVLDSAGFA